MTDTVEIIKIPKFKIGEQVVIMNPTHSQYGKPCVIHDVYADYGFCAIQLPDGNITAISPKDLDYAVQQKIAMLKDDDRQLVLQIIPKTWVAYDDNSMYFSAFSEDATPVFATKSELMGELATVYLDGRKRKTVKRKSQGVYWYTFPDADDKKTKRCFVIEHVTAQNLDRLRNLCIAGLCPNDYE